MTRYSRFTKTNESLKEDLNALVFKYTNILKEYELDDEQLNRYKELKHEYQNILNQDISNHKIPSTKKN